MLVDQVKAVTTATKEIEAKISSGVWDRQKRWEMKREVLFEATKRLGDFDDALVSLHTVYLTERINRKPGEPEWIEAKGSAAKKFGAAAKKFEESRLLAEIVCGKEVKLACDNFLLVMRPIATGITKDDAEIYTESARERTLRFLAVTLAIKKELEAT